MLILFIRTWLKISFCPLSRLHNIDELFSVSFRWRSNKPKPIIILVVVPTKAGWPRRNCQKIQFLTSFICYNHNTDYLIFLLTPNIGSFIVKFIHKFHYTPFFSVVIFPNLLSSNLRLTPVFLIHLQFFL